MSVDLRSTAGAALSLLGAGVLVASACGDTDAPGGPDGAAAVSGVSGSSGAGGSTNVGGAGGGHGGAGGSGGGGAGPDGPWPDGSGLDPDEQWVADASLWKSVPNTTAFQPCTIIEPDTKLPIAPLTWEGCGSGCEVANLPRLGAGGFLPAASNLRDGTAVRAVAAINETKVANGWVYKARRFIDLQNGETKGAAAAIHPAGGAESPCSVGRNVETARVSQVSGSTMRIEFTFEPAGGVLWMPTPFPQSETPFATGMAFDIDQPKPRFIAGAGTIYTHEFSAAGWTVLESSAPAEHGVGEAELAVWVEPAKSGVQRLRGWKDDGAGSFTLADSVPNITCKLGLSATSIVGLASDTNDCYEPTSVKLWRAARTAPNTDLTIGPDLPIPFSQVSSSYPVRSWGNYAGLQARSFAGGNVDRLLIVELSTWKMWTIAPRAGFRWTLGAFTMDEQHLYALEQPLDASQRFSTLDVATGVVRVPLASLAQSALATPVP